MFSIGVFYIQGRKRDIFAESIMKRCAMYMMYICITEIDRRNYKSYFNEL